MRTAVGILITLFWVSMMGLLIQREVLPGMRAAGPMQSAQPAQFRPSSSQMGFYLNERRMGSIQSEIAPAGDGSVNIVCVARLDVPLATVHFTIHLDREHKLQTFRIILRSNLVRTCIRGRTLGNRLEVTTGTGDRVTKRVVPFDPNAMVSTSLMPHLALPEIAIGKRWRVPTFDLGGKMAYVTVEVREKTTLAWRGRPLDVYRLETLYQGLTCNAWVTPDGVMLLTEVPFAGTRLVLKKEDPLPSDDPD